MDPITFSIVATQVVAVLTPLFSKVGEAIATKFGEDAYEASKHLYEIVRDRFAKNDDNGRASKALQNFADDPQIYGNVFEGNTTAFATKRSPICRLNYPDSTHRPNSTHRCWYECEG